MIARRIGLLLAVAALLDGCALSSIQSARPAAKGCLDLTLSGGLIRNDYRKDGPLQVLPVPQIAARYGLTDHLDIGLAPFLLTGGLIDAKGNLFGPSSRLALSLQTGFGLGFDAFGDGGAVHVPLNVLASYDLNSVFTPYVNLGYGTFWFFGQDVQLREPGVRYAKRTRFGDGALMARVGLELRFYHQSAVLLEAGWTQPIVDDPGDFFDLGKGYTAQIGVRF